MPDSDSTAALVDDATRALYALPPDEFMAARKRLADEARADGNPAAATRIAALRKPTVAAWIVNVLVAQDGSAVDRLVELGEQLREAQDALEPGRLRDLSVQRRKLVAELSRDAFTHAERADASTALRDEVTGTLDAAVADPDVAQRLGTLAKAERWSGFGFAPTGSPELTLLRGGQDTARKPKAKTTEPKLTPAQRRKQKRALAAARDALTAAETAHDDAQAAEHDLSQRVRKLASKVAELQRELDDAREALETAKTEVSETRAERRKARSALDRAEREASD